MSAPVVITINDTPLPKGRPRFGRGNVYTPASTRAYENAVGWAAKIAMRGRRLFYGPVKLEAAFYLAPPRSFLKPKNPFADFAIGRPDLDNLLKAVLDALNHIVVHDDLQIVALSTSKRYAAEPKIVVTVTPLADEGQ